MKKEPMKKKRSILRPLLVSSAVGAGIALLLAPKSGEKFRKNLKQFAVSRGKQVADVIDEGRDIYGEGRKVVARAVEAGRKIYDEGTELLDKLVHKKKRSLVVPIVASSIIGAGIAFLMAPKSGKAVREDMKRIAVDTRSKVVSLIDKGKVLTTGVIPKATDTGGKVLREVKKKILRAA